MGSVAFRHDVAVLVVPFPLHGHLNQLLHLSHLISAHIPVHYVATTAAPCRCARRRRSIHPLSHPNIIFHEFRSLPFHHHLLPSNLQSLFHASAALRHPVADLIRCLSATTRRVVVIYDSLMGSVVQDFAKFPNAEGYTFHSVSAYTIFFFLWEKLGKPFDVDPGILENLPSLDGCFAPEFIKFIEKQHKYLSLNSGRIYNTSRVIEDRFLEFLSKPEISGNKKQFALGPFNPFTADSGGGARRHRCLIWLDSQAADSVVLVSFGTVTTLSDKQIVELANGLETSGVKFIWVVRNDAGGGGFPVGFEERVKGRGMVVRDWAPQLEILGNPATGGFVSHCGWNSCIESITMGVPIAAWPVHSDQPRNAVLVTEVLGIGVVVRDWARREELVTAAEVAAAVTRLMGTEEGAEIRRRVAELRGAVRKGAAEGGATRRELDSFIEHITR